MNVQEFVRVREIDNMYNVIYLNTLFRKQMLR